jgi:LPS-assembly protein
MPAPAAAQILDRPLVREADDPLYLESDSLLYDTRSGRVTAVGNVYIEYGGYQLFATRVTYDPASETLAAAGGVRLEEPEGNIVIARELTLSDDLRDGFVTGLRADTIYRTRLAANRAERAGSVTIFEDAAYTACYTCRARPDEAPSWVIRARRVIVDEDERTLGFEDPRFELFGAVGVGLPSFTIPDPTVSRRSGFLAPIAVYSNLLGLGVRVPYFQTLGPSADVTVGVTPLSRQGVLGDVGFRQRTWNGFWSARAAGIYQLEPEAFSGTSGDQRLRGAFRTSGEFAINPLWRWGWESTLTTDRLFLDDYRQASSEDLTAPSTLYLLGLNDRTWFDARLWAFRILQDDYAGGDILDPPPPFTPAGQRLQGKQAWVHPVIDYAGVVDGAVLAGELSWRANLTALSRQETDAFGVIEGGVLEPRFRGVEGSFTRASAEVAWRRRLIAPLGQVLVPHASLRGDVFAIDNRDPDVTALEDGLEGRLMPAAGLTYSWPWLVTSSWGTQTVEPVAQIVARPDELLIGSLPNNDAQSVVFDTANLFDPTRFSGFDRAEGGVRASVGLRYTAQTYSGGFVSAILGQSYHLAGRNSYRVPDLLDSAAGSGLSQDRSDLVAGLIVDTNGGFALTAEGRFDDETLDVERAELSAAARLGPVSAKMVYAFLRDQPDLGILDEREEVQGGASLRVVDNVRLFGMLRYDLEDREFIRSGVGVGYDDDALSVSLAYSEDRGSQPDDPVDRTVFFRVGLRTIGDVGASTSLDD